MAPNWFALNSLQGGGWLFHPVCCRYWVMLAISLVPIQLRAADEEPLPVKIERDGKWATLFGDQELTFKLKAISEKPVQGRLVWSLASLEKRTLSRGEVNVAIAPRQRQAIELTIQLPPVKQGVIVPVLLTTGLYVDGQADPQGRYQENFWIFPSDPFYDRNAWLKERGIILYDPAGKTADLFADVKIPFERQTNISELGALQQQQLLIVGEGVSFREERALPEIMAQLASRGVSVLCLAPADGDFPVPQRVDHEKFQLNRAMLFQSDVIEKIDQRLDAAQWMSDEPLATRSITFVGEGSSVVGRVVDSATGWPWLEFLFANELRNTRGPSKTGRLVIVCFEIVRRWDDGPTPRFLFARLVEHVAQPSPDGLNPERKVK